MSKSRKFEEEVAENIRRLGADEALKELSLRWIVDSSRYGYSYNFRWLGRPIIQFPQDIIALQEIIWDYRPDLVVETGIAHGGSLILYASLLELVGNGSVVGVDIDIREHNRTAIEQHPLSKRIEMIQGSSIAPEVIARVVQHRAAQGKVMVVLDSDHTHAHVLAELEAYSRIVKKGGYVIVMDTRIEDAPAELWPNRSWRKGNSPKTAVWEFLKHCDRFVVDEDIERKLLITVAPSGYLRCVKD